MADTKELDNFIDSIPPPYNYLDLGYDRNFSKNLYSTRSRSSADFNAEIESISFDRISQGVSSSPNGRIKIDFERGRILINDGAHDRVIIGSFD